MHPDFVSGEPPADASQRVRDIYAAWDRARAGRPMPARTDIDPAALGPDLLPYVVIAELETDPFRIRYRLVGTRIAHFSKLDFTGRYLDEMSWPSVPAITDIFRHVWRTGRPAFGRFGIELTVGGWYRIDYANMPLSAPASEGTAQPVELRQFLILEDYHDVDAGGPAGLGSLVRR